MRTISAFLAVLALALGASAGTMIFSAPEIDGVLDFGELSSAASLNVDIAAANQQVDLVGEAFYEAVLGDWLLKMAESNDSLLVDSFLGLTPEQELKFKAVLSIPQAQNVVGVVIAKIVPEPGTAATLALGLAMLATASRRRFE